MIDKAFVNGSQRVTSQLVIVWNNVKQQRAVDYGLGSRVKGNVSGLLATEVDADKLQVKGNVSGLLATEVDADKRALPHAVALHYSMRPRPHLLLTAHSLNSVVEPSMPIRDRISLNVVKKT